MTPTRNKRLAICKDCCDYRKVCRDCERCDECSQHAACEFVEPDAEDAGDLVDK